MATPFSNLPFNTEKVYTGAIAPGGCQVFIPVFIYDEHLIQQRKNELQTWLDNQASVTTELPDTLA